MADGTFSGDPFVTVEEKADGNDLKVSLKFNELFGQDLSLRTPNNIRRTYRNFMGTHELVGTSEDLGLTIRKNIVLRPYEDFHTHDEMLAAIEKSRQDAKTDRLVKIETTGKSAQGRDVKLGIISSDQKSIDDYLNTTNRLALTKPAEILTALKNGTLDWFSISYRPCAFKASARRAKSAKAKASPRTLGDNSACSKAAVNLALVSSALPK